MKTLHLIIKAKSDYYDRMYEALSSFYSTYTDVDSYFIEYVDDLSSDYVIDKNMILLRGTECYVPGILRKTIAIDTILKQELHDYEIIIRSNLSTVINFLALRNYLSEIQDLKRIYLGANFLSLNGPNPSFGITAKALNGTRYFEGTLIGLGRELFNEILSLKDRLDYTIIDDVAIGHLIRTEKISHSIVQIPSNLTRGWNGYDTPYTSERVKADINCIAWRNKSVDRSVDASRVELITKTVTKELSNDAQPDKGDSTPININTRMSDDKKDNLHGAIAYALAESDKSMRILYIDPNIPSLNTDAGAECSFHYIFYLRALGYEVDYLPLLFRERFLEHARELSLVGVHVLDSRSFTRQKVFEWVFREANKYKIVIASRPDVGIEFVRRGYEWLNRPSRPYLIYNIVDFHFERMSRQALLTNNRDMEASSVNMKDAEVAILNYFDGAIFLNDREFGIARQLGFSGHDFRWGLPVQMKGIPLKPRQKTRIIFLGSAGHQPNVDAILWFISDVWPSVKKRHSNLTLDIIGSGFDKIFPFERNFEGITVHGFVEDLRPLFDTAICSIAPLRFGAGVKGKIATSLGLGVPVICSTIAAEGFPNPQNQRVIQCLAEFDARSFTYALDNLMSDIESTQVTSKSALAYCSKFFDSRTLLWGIARSISSNIPSATSENIKQLFSLYESRLESIESLNVLMNLVKNISMSVGLPASVDLLLTVPAFLGRDDSTSVTTFYQRNGRLLPVLSWPSE
jgi:hypothetical protein